MKENLVIESAVDWLALAEITFPPLKSELDNGTTFTVYKVGFLAVREQDCQELGIHAERGPAGKCVLPTSVIDFAGERKLCRLPVELSPWAFNCVAMAHEGLLKFPATVEFGLLDGRKYAEII
jgi:hypothetical protein